MVLFDLHPTAAPVEMRTAGFHDRQQHDITVTSQQAISQPLMAFFMRLRNGGRRGTVRRRGLPRPERGICLFDTSLRIGS